MKFDTRRQNTLTDSLFLCLVAVLHVYADVVELVDTTDLRKLSAPMETPGVELLKFGESFQRG